MQSVERLKELKNYATLQWAVYAMLNKEISKEAREVGMKALEDVGFFDEFLQNSGLDAMKKRLSG